MGPFERNPRKVVRDWSTRVESEFDVYNLACCVSIRDLLVCAEHQSLSDDLFAYAGRIRRTSGESYVLGKYLHPPKHFVPVPSCEPPWCRL